VLGLGFSVKSSESGGVGLRAWSLGFEAVCEGFRVCVSRVQGVGFIQGCWG
jgi:hypothetical protein